MSVTRVRIFRNGADVSEEIELRGGRANPFGWSQQEIWHGDTLIGFLESGAVFLREEGYTFTETEEAEPSQERPVAEVQRLLNPFYRTVLAAVADLGDPYGAPLHEALERQLGGFVSVGQMYLALQLLQEWGCLASRTEEGTPERGGRRRRHWWLTRYGEQVLVEEGQ